MANFQQSVAAGRTTLGEGPKGEAALRELNELWNRTQNVFVKQNRAPSEDNNLKAAANIARRNIEYRQITEQLDKFVSASKLLSGATQVGLEQPLLKVERSLARLSEQLKRGPKDTADQKAFSKKDWEKETEVLAGAVGELRNQLLAQGAHSTEKFESKKSQGGFFAATKKLFGVGKDKSELAIPDADQLAAMKRESDALFRQRQVEQSQLKELRAAIKAEVKIQSLPNLSSWTLREYERQLRAELPTLNESFAQAGKKFKEIEKELPRVKEQEAVFGALLERHAAEVKSAAAGRNIAVPEASEPSKSTEQLARRAFTRIAKLAEDSKAFSADYPKSIVPEERNSQSTRNGPAEFSIAQLAAWDTKQSSALRQIREINHQLDSAPDSISLLPVMAESLTIHHERTMKEIAKTPSVVAQSGDGAVGPRTTSAMLNAAGKVAVEPVEPRTVSIRRPEPGAVMPVPAREDGAVGAKTAQALAKQVVTLKQPALDENIEVKVRPAADGKQSSLAAIVLSKDDMAYRGVALALKRGFEVTASVNADGLATFHFQSKANPADSVSIRDTPFGVIPKSKDDTRSKALANSKSLHLLVDYNVDQRRLDRHKALDFSRAT